MNKRLYGGYTIDEDIIHQWVIPTVDVTCLTGYTCGWSRCDCAGGLLWDEQSGYCVEQSECPPYGTKTSRRKSGRGERRKNDPRKYRKSKKVEIREEEEPFPS